MAESEQIIGGEGVGSGEDYRAFLLRCWQEPGAGPGGEPAWRFTLVRVENEGGQRGFASLAELVEHLRQELGMDE
jgi:hypothetical protein